MAIKALVAVLACTQLACADYIGLSDAKNYSTSIVVDPSWSFSHLARLEVNETLYKLEPHLTVFSNVSFMFQPEDKITVQFRKQVEKSRLILDVFCFCFPSTLDSDLPDVDIYLDVRDHLDYLHKHVGDYKDHAVEKHVPLKKINKEREEIRERVIKLQKLLHKSSVRKYFRHTTSVLYERRRKYLPKYIWGNTDIPNTLPNTFYTGVGNIAALYRAFLISVMRRWDVQKVKTSTVFAVDHSEYLSLHSVRKMCRVAFELHGYFKDIAVSNQTLMDEMMNRTHEFYRYITRPQAKFNLYWHYKFLNDTKNAEKQLVKAQAGWEELIQWDAQLPKHERFDATLKTMSTAIVDPANYVVKHTSIWTYIVVTVIFCFAVLLGSMVATYMYRKHWFENNGYQPIGIRKSRNISLFLQSPSFGGLCCFSAASIY